MVGVAQLVEPPGCDPGCRGFESHRSPHILPVFAKVAELVDALDLGSSGATCESSSLSFRTILLAIVTFSLIIFEEVMRWLLQLSL